MTLFAEKSAHIPLQDSAFTVLHSSTTLGWSDILVEHVVLRRGELFVPRLDDHLVCMVLEEQFTVEQSRYGKTFVHTFETGQAQVLPVDTSGYWRSNCDAHLLHLQFSHTFFQHLAAETQDADPSLIEVIDQFLIQDPHVKHIGLALYAELLDGGENGQLYHEALSNALATHLLRKYAHVSSKTVTIPRHISRTELKKAIEYINDHLADEIGLNTLARQVNLSTSHFNALFKQTLGVAPYQYILKQRVDRAKNLLLHSDRSVVEVATDVGFYDQSHLTRHMRRLLGITPSALQRQRNVQNPR